jgi:integrase
LPDPGSGSAGRRLRGCNGGAGATRRANFSGSATAVTTRSSTGIISMQASTRSFRVGLEWPKVKFKEKRAITLEEHQRIIAAEVNPERKTLYQLCWHLGASQGDIASLRGEDVDWTNNTVGFTRKKSGVPVLVHLGADALNVFKDLPAEGVLFPYLSRVRAGDRATEFGQRCRQLGITGITLHSYRYAWAERAKVAGYPERFAQEALGHNSKAVHRAYAKRALMKIPSLEEYEERAAEKPTLRV